MNLGLYIDADTPVHRIRPGIKVASLAVLGTLAFLVSDPILLSGGLAAVVLLYRVARIPWRTMFDQMRPVLWILGVIFVVQVAIHGWIVGLIFVVRFAALILLAMLVTLTTPTSTMLDALEKGLRPLARVGIDPARVSLALSLALRFIPVIAAVTQEVREAQRARGLQGNILALAVPVIIRTLKMAEDIAQAIEARSPAPPPPGDERAQAAHDASAKARE